MSNILLDTSIIIDATRQKDIKQTVFYKLAQSKSELYISILSYAESYAGKSVWEDQSAKKTLETLLSGTKILPLDEITSKEAGKIEAEHSIGIVDAIIAATALHYKLPLATLNLKDFKKIKGLKLWGKD